MKIHIETNLTRSYIIIFYYVCKKVWSTFTKFDLENEEVLEVKKNRGA